MQTKIIKKCFLCEGENAIINKNNNKPIYEVSCENCGKYKITDVLLLKPITRKEKQAVIWFIKNNTDELIGEKNIEWIEQEYKIYMQSNRY